MPVIKHEKGGYLLHEVDVATNKMLAMVSRSEARDFVDALFILERVLPLGPLVRASVAKDPGFTPLSLLEHLKRQGRYRPEEIARLDLAAPFDLVEAKETWLGALTTAESFIATRPPDEVGCLYWDRAQQRFVAPDADDDDHVVPHYGRAGGILPRPSDSASDSVG